MEELNKLASKLFKAELVGNTELVEKYKLEIEEYKKNNANNTKATNSSNHRTEREIDNELNKLSAKLIKAQMLGNQELIEKSQRDIDEYKAKRQSESKDSEKIYSNEEQDEIQKNKSNTDDRNVPTKSDIKKEKVSSFDDEFVDLQLENKQRRLVELRVKLQKAELRNDQNSIEQCKKLINELLASDKLLAKADKGEVKTVSINLEQIYDDLIEARMTGDRKKISACEDKIEKIEYTFNFRSIDDLKKLCKMFNDCLMDVVKAKDEEVVNGNQRLVKHLDRKAKAIRQKVIEHDKRLDDLIKAKQAEDRLIKKERNESQNEQVKTLYVKRKLNENQMSLSELFVSERNAGPDSEISRFVNTSSRLRSQDDEYEDFTGKKRSKTGDQIEYKVENKEDEKCDKCLDRIKSHLMIEHNERLVLFAPVKEPLIKTQLTIRSVDHCASLAEANEDVFEAVDQLKSKINMLFESLGKTIVFIETYLKKNAKWNRHFEINCYPIDAHMIQEAKMCFKKEINEIGGDWTMNKKLVLLTAQKPLNRSVPKGLSYFCVTFGAGNDGFAHVIEDAQRFSRHFGQEVIGGLLDISPQAWLNPATQHFEVQMQRINEIKKLWSRLSVSSR